MVAPAGVVDPDLLGLGVAVLRDWGFDVRLGEHVLDRRRYCAGTPADRARDLEAMFLDPEVGAIVCARGGYGSAEVLPLLDPARLAAHPKLVCGYSDVSPLLGFLVERCDLPGLHGPMVTSDLAREMSPRAAARMRALLARADAAWEEPVADVVVSGVGEGRLVGGCLASLTALLGTPYAVETDGAVLFLEDVAEHPYRIERMLTQLRLAGKLAGVAAVVLGSFADCNPGEADDVGLVFRECFAEAPYPVVAGFPAGHRSENLALALGLPVRVDTVRGVVEAGIA